MGVSGDIYSNTIDGFKDIKRQTKEHKYYANCLAVAPKVKELCELLDNERIEEINPIMMKSKNIYNMLYERFSKVLDNRDWQYLDLVIFYLQTGRADNLKEALQQVDRQVQTEAIVQAVNNASQEICNTIKREINSLKKAISKRLDIITSQNNLMIEQNDLQNALLAKMAYSSQRLVTEVKVVVN